ncbi:HAMP domain-containing histidine kinase [Formicincola oecophyllae]|uniref:histidine kinase n=1 Tax=Formicincola oecophyllae TaxID=2558361 RepID=A0A4Y6U860_9PROT|nr:HAMP domain-containing sensor histidine kinase [Formicincola oecophyllae]QDH13170.1 HAMP domain-containing histidine kinase [Formicincola oecophyllae]
MAPPAQPPDASHAPLPARLKRRPAPWALFRASAFRLMLGLALVICLGMCAQILLLYTHMNTFERNRDIHLLRASADVLEHESPSSLEVSLQERDTNELRIILNGAGLFDAHRVRIHGDIRHWPRGLDARPGMQRLSVNLPDGTRTFMRFLVDEVPGPYGTKRFLVLERSGHTMAAELQAMLRQSALFSIGPVVAFALLGALFLSHRALGRVAAIHQAVDEVMEGDLGVRLPVRPGTATPKDDIDALAMSVNFMLDRLEQLVGEIRDVTNNIAHDLRTPLARARARLERLTRLATSLPPLQRNHVEEAVAASTGDLEHCFRIITAILRIGEIESAQRHAGFAVMDLVAMLRDIADFYEVAAEERHQHLILHLPSSPVEIYGDEGLLSEVVANLLDNAMKFTPRGGTIILEAGNGAIGPWFSVTDTGPGIPVEERKNVLGRFYRADKSRHVPGSGLGLSLVAAIAGLHGARIDIMDGAPTTCTEQVGGKTGPKTDRTAGPLHCNPVAPAPLPYGARFKIIFPKTQE